MVTAIIILSIIGLISATLLYIISRKFHVEEDSRIDEIESILPGANCGGCGYAVQFLFLTDKNKQRIKKIFLV